MSESISRSWFVVFNNPEKHGYIGTPDEIVNRLKDEWISGNPLRKGYWAYCISSDGLKHVHMVLEHSGAMRFSAVKKVYPTAHLEPTKGSKSQVKAYIKKEGVYTEKGEQVIATASFGNIEGFKRYALNNNSEVLLTIETLVDEGKTPSEIMQLDIRLRKEEALIRKAYFAKRYKETPPIRNVKVVWHVGESGTGKSYSYVKLCEKHGDDNVYFFSDYSNKGVGGFDNYCGEPILFMDELKPNSLPFELLLTITQGYRSQIHCRYANCYTLWNEVHITSVFTPEQLYDGMITKSRNVDTMRQLLRRIDEFVFHYIENGKYKTITTTGKNYLGIDNLKSEVHNETMVK